MHDTTKKAVIGSKEVFAGNRVISIEQYEKTRQYHRKYQRDSYKQLQIKFYYSNSDHMLEIEWVGMQLNANKYIRDLVKADMARKLDEGKIMLTEDHNVHVTGDPAEIGCDLAQSEEYWKRHPKKQVKHGKVGRPRKIVTEAAVSQEVAVTDGKRRRGRPRKKLQEVETDSVTRNTEEDGGNLYA